MTPDNPQDPPKGKAGDVAGETAEEAKLAKEAAAQEKASAKADATGKAAKTEGEAKPKKPRARKADGGDAAAAPKTRKAPAVKAKEKAAEDTGVDKAAAKAGAEAEDEPKKPGRKKAVTKAETAAKDSPKPARRREAGERVVVKAQARYVRTSARKARLVCEHIRGKDVQEARAILAFTPRAAAKDWSKVLESAVANAEHNHELVGEELRIVNVFADEGPTLKRFRPRAMGRASRIRKRTSHLTIELTPKEQ